MMAVNKSSCKYNLNGLDYFIKGIIINFLTPTKFVRMQVVSGITAHKYIALKWKEKSFVRYFEFMDIYFEYDGRVLTTPM